MATEMINHHEGFAKFNLSNHKTVTQIIPNLIKRTAVGRQKIYELANPEVAQLIELLLNMQHASPVKKERVIKPIQFARTCYDHLAGKLGVAIFEKLLEKKAVQFPEETAMKDEQFFSDDLGLADAFEVFGKLGIDLGCI